MPRKKAATRGGSRSHRGTNRVTRTTQRKTSTGNNARGRREVETLEDGFVAELADMLHGETQVLDTLQKMIPKVQSRRLQNVIEVHVEQTEQQIDRLHRVFQLLGRPARPEKCEGLQGILEEGDELIGKTGPGPVRDAMIVAAAQKVEHYEIASYGTLCAWAEQLDLEPALRLLDESLFEEKSMDRNLSWVAESVSNEQALPDGTGMRTGRDRGMRGRPGPGRDEMDRETSDRRSRGFDGGRMFMEARAMDPGRERSGRYRQRDED